MTQPADKPGRWNGKWCTYCRADTHTDNEIEGSDWLCHYELVIRLGKNDIRNPREYKQESEKAMPLGGTKVNTTVEPLRNGTVQTPFRDSGHMKWDAEQLGIKHCYAIYGDIVTPLGQSNERPEQGGTT